MTSGITEYEAKIIDLRDGIVRAAMAGQYQDADDLLTTFADEIRVEAAEKVAALKRDVQTQRPTDYISGMIDAYNNAEDIITRKEPTK